LPVAGLNKRFSWLQVLFLLFGVNTMFLIFYIRAGTAGSALENHNFYFYFNTFQSHPARVQT
jgi:hypothetical protein